MKDKFTKKSKGQFSQLVLLLIVVVMITLTGCESLPFDINPSWMRTPTSVSGTEVPPEPDATATEDANPSDVTATPAPTPSKLILWLPPELDPHGETEAAGVLMEKLNEFAYANKVEIVIRIKSKSGAGSLTDSLTATRTAAPEILPDLILLSSPELSLAARRNLIYANDGIANLLGGTDWYPFARQLGTIEEEVLAVAAMIDPYAMVYNASSQLIPSNDWDQIHKNFGIFGFAAEDPMGKFLLLQYMNAGGSVMDGQGYALLEEDSLITALQVLKDSLNTRHINDLSLTYQNDSQVWQSFLDRNLDTAVVPVSLVLSYPYDNPEEPRAAMTEPSISIGPASAWALANPDTSRQELALVLLEELMQTEFLGRWTEALHKLPSRPSALGVWTHPTLKPALEVLAETTRILPEDSVINQLGPILRNATLLILRDSGDVVETALQAIESLK